MTERVIQNHQRIMISKRHTEIARYFIRLGLTGFGGPLAIVAQMERDLTSRGWISKEKYAQAFAAIKTMPGPVAFQTAVFMGQLRGGFFGAAIAGFMLNFSAAVLMVFLASSRSTWNQWSWVQSFNIGLQAAALGLVAASVIPLARSARTETSRNPKAKQIAKVSFVLLGFAITAARPSLEPLAILVCGGLAMLPSRRLLIGTTPLALSAGLIGLSSTEIASSLGWTCFKAGAMVFGSGLAIVPLLGSEFVDRLHWLTQAEFLEALMFGQVTPGPIVITATYIGYRVLGFSGAALATVAVFSAPFFHMTTWFPRLWEKISTSRRWNDFSFGAIACVVGSVMASVVKLAEPVWLTALEIETVKPSPSLFRLMIWVVLPVASFMLTWKRKTPAWLLIIAGGVLSFVFLKLVRA